MIFNSPYPDTAICEQPLTEFVLQRAVELADKPALIDGLTNSLIRYKQLADFIYGGAIGLAARGFSKGDVLAIYSPNLPEYAIAFHAAATLGGIITTVNPSYTAEELAYQLNDAGAKYLITIPELVAQALEAVGQSKVEEVFVFGEADGATSFSVLLESEGEIPKVHINPQSDLVALLYSSGTTGMPKGVMHTHHTFVSNFHQFQNCEPVSEADAVIGVLPFFHCYGMLMLNYSLAKGATIVTMPRFDLETFLSLIEKHKITRIHVVPPILLALAKQAIVDKYNLSSLRVLTSAAAPLSHQLIKECEQRLPNCIVKQAYGTTETCLNSHTPDEHDKIKPGSVGQCLSHVECQIVTELGVDIPIEMFLGSSNINQLVNLLLQQLAAKNTIPSQKSSAQLAADLNSEIVLDSTILPEYPFESFITEPTSIFLTGATGFLGAFLLQELLLKTQANVYCLVRSTDAESGKKRIQNSLESYGIWNDDFAERVIPVLGDLSQPLLGLSSQDFQKMSSIIDVIYHNAAWINYVYPYSALKPTNVLGTQEILRLASRVKIKPVHYISTIAVFESPAYGGKVVTESDQLTHSEGMKLAYSQSKWVAEKLVMIARDRGIPVSIYRPPFISGHSQTGTWYKDDVICRTIKGCIQMGSMTDITDTLDLAPVDYLSQSIVYLSQQKDSLGKAFHLSNSQPISWRELTDFICSLGYKIEHIAYRDWQIQLNNSVRSRENSLYHLLPFYHKQYQQSTDPKMSCLATQNALAGSSIMCPPVNAQLLNTYFSYFIRCGWLDVSPPSNNPALMLPVK
jgi:thioester reductase-like protein